MNQKNISSFFNKKDSTTSKEKNQFDVISVTYEEIGLFPRSFSRVTDRFLQQIFSDVDHLIIHEYRFYRYLFFTTFKSLLILFCVPFLVHFLAKNYVIRPLTEYIWNSQQTEIFLNTYQQKRAFLELKEFEEKLYFESLIGPKENSNFSSSSNFLQKTRTISENFWNPLNFSNFDSDKATRSNSYVYLKKKSSNLLNSENQLKNTKIFSSGNSLFFLKNEQKIEKKVNSIVFQGHISSPHSNSVKRKKLIYFFQPIEPTFLKEIRNIDSKDDTFYVKVQNIKQRSRVSGSKTIRTLQEKTIALAIQYNSISIEAITNFFSDLISFWTLCYLLFALEIQINITKSFLLEVFFGLDDSKKSLLILLVTDLLVGYHSSNIWELFFEFIFDHYGFAESQTGVFLLVATLPVLLDVLFKYLIFRHLNRSSPATVATYRSMIE